MGLGRTAPPRAAAVAATNGSSSAPLVRCAANGAAAPPPAAHRRGRPLRGCPPWAHPRLPPLAANVLRDVPSRRFVRFARRPVVTRARLSPFWRSVAATSRMFSWRSDRWIGDFFAPSQSHFTGPTSSACISSTVAPFDVLPVPV
ncbi:formin-like protein 5 [Iris pallida]|uniref:Formin-like protein 5 n=1 Tax=Iris pallida TaxID=29817 RepID=A0AAX6ILJ7_IRIPA|nr:formin-like protein 5 [Iris pallida]